MTRATKIGDGWYTDDAEYVVSGSKVTRGDGSYCRMSSYEEAMEAAELLAKGEKDDADYDWQY